MASHSVICYPQPGKFKSSQLLEAFAHGAGGIVDGSANAAVDVASPSAFYGTMGIENLLKQAQATGKDWYYGDNAYFDNLRSTHYRFARNQYQMVDLRCSPDEARAKAAGLVVKPWRKPGSKIIVVEQSQHFYRTVGAPDDWAALAIAELKKHTDREIVYRSWNRDKAKLSRTLHSDLDDAWALVTHMSSAANEALLYGVPVFVTGKSAAFGMGRPELFMIEYPIRPDDRELWLHRLVCYEWTLEEIKEGKAWRVLSAV